MSKNTLSEPQSDSASYTELTLYGSKNECARTDTVFLPVSEVCDGVVFLNS